MNHLFSVQTESPAQRPSQENQLSKVNSGSIGEPDDNIAQYLNAPLPRSRRATSRDYDELNILDATAESAGTFSAIAMELPFPAVFPLLDGEN